MALDLSLSTVIAILLASIRAGVWLALCPPFSNKGTPTTVKGLLSIAIALPLAPKLATQVPPEISTGFLVTNAIEQAAVGAALAFLTMLIFAATQIAGNLIDLVGGFTLAFALDPFSLQGNAVFGRFYGLITMAIMYATDAHQLILRGFTSSYTAIPLNGTMDMTHFTRLVTTGTAQMFLAGLQISAPLIGIMLAVDVALGLLTRAAPALNPFSFGYPAKIFLTLSIAGTAMMLLPNAMANLTTRAINLVLELFNR
ncbi:MULTISPECIES: flagellar biosynthetic protein FliR [Dactylosporangium]|uniref:Flagellar biosynthetic protein FliR n=2 Tax=Dactylosporangium TaxID=35753 RepID=A0A9W6KWS5_9ACTN|nr:MULTISPECIES: flagellar biosynthetic protein FliR [Dactylosporangium]UAB95503.1 flagellar biosynthetic protein FliR [Dactylosporangium vinaceum]UWZ43822.1 flagellar biosynthetic protein FliR [Dactylosporangium matsuzakiense]GLL08625.1 flagellar biosynthetic protein FliR [Dactylosporangium matsuzakiense]